MWQALRAQSSWVETILTLTQPQPAPTIAEPRDAGADLGDPACPSPALP